MSDDPPPADPVESYRLSDAERDQAISALADAYAEGRLDIEEFTARMAAASRATYATQLDPLFADLPARPRTRALPAAPRGQRTVPRGGPMLSSPPWGPPGWGAPRRNAGPHRAPPPWILVPMIVVLLAASSGAWLLIPIVVVLTRHRVRARACASARPAQMGSEPGRHLPAPARDDSWRGRSCR